MELIKFYCPYCEQKLGAKSSLRGELVECKTCNNDVFVPKEDVNVPQSKSLLDKVSDLFDHERSFSVDDLKN